MNAFVLPVLVIAVGGVLIAAALPLPEYDDPHWQERFLAADVRLENSDALSAEWYAAKAKAQTARNARLDLGMGIVALGFGAVILLAALGVRQRRDLAMLTTPSTHARFYIVSALSWLSFIPAEWTWLGYTQNRGDYPWWADTIAIPSAGVLLFGIGGLPVVLLGVWLAIRGAQLPAALWSRPLLGSPYVVTSGLLAAAVLALAVTISAITSEPFLVPSCVFIVYLLLSGRAAAVRRGAV